MSLITVKDLSLRYDTGTIAEGISFEVNEGDYLCIVGQNGSGKTSLMRALLGLMESSSGEILTGDGLKRSQIGYLPQLTTVQKDFPASVKEIVLSGCGGRSGLRPFYSKYEKELASTNMERMGITGLKNRCYRDLSGGQQQRVLLARALCAADKVLILDEPVSGLDPLVSSEMYKLISDLNKDGVTIIMISHDITSVLAYASHILHMSDDVFFGTVDEYRLSREGSSII